MQSPHQSSNTVSYFTKITTTMNPYGQAGWSQAGQGRSNALNSGTPPSLFGALPSLQPTSGVPRSMQPDSITYQFTSFNSTILNCNILKSGSEIAYRVVTEASAPSCTIFKDNSSRNAAMIEWQPTTLEIRNVASKQRLRDWLRLSSDRRLTLYWLMSLRIQLTLSNSRRYMVVNGIQYAWVPMDNFICVRLRILTATDSNSFVLLQLYKVQTSAPRVLARIARAPTIVLLEMTPEALNLGLLEPSLVATVIFVSGHNID